MRLILSLLIVVFLFSCNNSKSPDVSGIKANITTFRFEKDLFTADSSHFAAALDSLIVRYPSFGENFLYTILNTDPQWTSDSATAYVSGFVNAYRYVYDSSLNVFENFTPIENEIKSGLQYLKFYYPDYKLPAKIITYIGPMDGYGDILTEDALIIGLQHHLGKNFSLYNQPWVQEVYANYISSRFEPSYISVNCMKNIILDMYPEKNDELSLVNQMVEKGKILYMLSKLLPKKEEFKLIGYSEEQLKSSYKHEASIWNMFVQNNLLQTKDNNFIKNYIGESPKTQELGEDAPGNIGSFTGWQIVKKYMEKNPDTTLQDLMKKDPESIFQQAKYKP